MDRLCSILEEAQTVVNADFPYQLQETNLNFPSMTMMNNGFNPALITPTLTPMKPVAHKATKALAKKRTWKKPKDKPKRPLSAYNLFFQHERKNIIAVLPDDQSVTNDGLTEEQRRRKHRKTHGKIGFADLARNIALKWKTIDKSARTIFETRADVERQRYKKELDAWKKIQKEIEGDKPKPVKKKAPLASKIASSGPAPSLPPHMNGDNALTNMLTSSMTAQRAQLLQFMMKNQQMMFPQQNNTMNPLQMHDALMSSCSNNNMYQQQSPYHHVPNHMHQQQQQQQQQMQQQQQQQQMQEQQQRMHQHNQLQQQQQQQQQHTMYNNNHPFRAAQPTPMNPLTMIDLTASNDEASPRRLRRPIAETFEKETFFEDLGPAGQDIYSEDASIRSSLDDDIKDFMDDFDAEILLS